jgi:hypothetical protein
VAAGTSPSNEPGWARRIPGWSLLLFFLSLAVLTAIAVSFDNANELELAGYFAGLASTVPLLAIIIPYYARPVWSIQVPGFEDAVARKVDTILADRGPRLIAERKGPFTRCTSVLALERPRCALGFYPVRPPAESLAIAPRTAIILTGPVRERRALVELRETLRRPLAEPTRLGDAGKRF